MMHYAYTAMSVRVTDCALHVILLQAIRLSSRSFRGSRSVALFARSLQFSSHFRLSASDEADGTAAENVQRLIRAWDRIREVDAVNRRKLRVLQVALEETWEVAKILEKNQYEEEVEPELAFARKEAEGARKRKKEEEEEEEEEEAVSDSSSEFGEQF